MVYRFLAVPRRHRAGRKVLKPRAGDALHRASIVRQWGSPEVESMMDCEKLDVPLYIEDLIAYIDLMLDAAGIGCERMRSNVANIARRALGERQKFTRATDKTKLMGIILHAVFEEGYLSGVLQVTDAIAQGIRDNENLRKGGEVNVKM
jgi:hypothetical protein